VTAQPTVVKKILNKRKGNNSNINEKNL